MVNPPAMRYGLMFMIFCCLAVHGKGQSPVGPGITGFSPWTSTSIFNGIPGDSLSPQKKWHLNGYMGISAGVGQYNGMYSPFLAAPTVGLQLTRQLNNNWYAFAGVSAAPAVYNMYSYRNFHSYNQGYPGGMFTPGGFGIYSRAELGIMYVNDAKTFSISGSIGVEQGSYPAFPTSHPDNRRQTTPTGTRK